MVVVANVSHGLAADRTRLRSVAAPQSAPGVPDLGVGVLFDRLLDAVVIARLSTGRIVMWNAAAEKLFGYPAAEAIGRSIEILMPEPIAHVHRAGLERYIRTGHGLIVDADSPVEMPARTKRGEEIRVELALSELQSPDGERFALAVIRDAMHRKQLELTTLELTQARLARSEFESALSAQSELLDAVATLLETTPAPDELQRLAHALADLKRLRAGELRARPVEVDLVDLVHATADAARRRTAGRRLLVHTPPSAPASCDPVRFRQVLDQVLDELIQRSSERAQVELRVEQVSPQLVQTSVRTDVRGGGEPGVSLLVSRMLMRHQGGSLRAEVTPSGSLEVILTAPAYPYPNRRRTGRPRKTVRPTSRP
jgi:PAS domain S-box-containing protein